MVCVTLLYDRVPRSRGIDSYTAWTTRVAVVTVDSVDVNVLAVATGSDVYFVACFYSLNTVLKDNK